ncbi:mothers against decapentaplegic homolog 3-like isoform X2 [Paramacrobiotus metropolitanus]|uniref:mothers against decapentaplegic homolog 3-like isoform X2 n=1 Tax=Paramacrobiotus metropolitanus TaxID=2943436 RepID=UPI002445FF79|nr:mothers against decapentaplegic homolog 3-like isoform X2 [Paramacrobiotus metropolitanus]
MNSFFNLPIVKKLMALKKSSRSTSESDEKWEEKAVKGLMKKLKQKGKGFSTVDDLERALSSQDKHSQCVIIPRTLDGRLQVGDRKGMAQVLYCRIWRWPDLTSYRQLRSTDTCSNGFSTRKDVICVNPYHYDRIMPEPGNALVNGVPVDGNRPLDSGELFFPEVDSPTWTDDSGMLSGSDTLTAVESSFSDDDSNSVPSPGSSGDTNSHAPMSPDVDPADGEPVAFVEPAFWCSVNYYELDARVGEAFHASLPSVTIDGFTDPSNAERFCLGALSNIKRDPVVKFTRRYIGKGVRLYTIGGDVYAECLGECAVFVQSASYNQRNGLHPATVCGIAPGWTLKIFSNQEFAAVLTRAAAQGFEAVYELAKMCTIRMSFVKGWGDQYRRQTVHASPCWIEIHVNGPLLWLDQVLKLMDSPGIPCSSNT